MRTLEVNGKSYIAIAGEVHNSNSSDPAYMENVWKQAKNLGMNTLLLPATWEMIEPEEGIFNFEVIDQLIQQARVNGMHIIFLWFGSWKNAQCMYAPSWVKTNLSRFPRAEIEKGKTKISLPEFYGMQYTTLSYMGNQTCEADANAFATFMAHLKKVDEETKTVIAVQVENETGIQGAVREHSDMADQVFAGQVPKEFIVYLKNNTEQMDKKIKAIIEKCLDQGDWQTVFGEMAEEIFSTYMISGYVGKVAAAGRKEYNLPLLVNCWLDREGDTDRKPGVYPAGGPVAKMMEIWKYQAKDIDIYAPDIYVRNFTDICDEYVKLDNPLFIPETAIHSHCAPRLVYCVGHYHAAGYSPFGFEDMGLPFQTTQGILFGMDTSDPMLQIPQDKEEYVFVDSIEQAKELLKKHEIAGVISSETSIWVENGLSAIVTTGGSDIYYGINKNRPDLKEELDNAMRSMENDKPFYADELYQQYIATQSVAVLSSEEQSWLDQHGAMGKVAGTGLGMPIVKKLIEMMGGSIGVESELGKGTKFTIILPHKIADERYYKQKSESEAIPVKEVLKDKRILLAEDNELNAEIASTILEDMGLKINRVEDGIQCVNEIERMPAGTYDMILMDIQMPNMNGYKATEAIRALKDKNKANIPIVAMTANAFEEDKKMAISKGMNDHIAKPIDVKKVEEVLLSILK